MLPHPQLMSPFHNADGASTRLPLIRIWISFVVLNRLVVSSTTPRSCEHKLFDIWLCARLAFNPLVL